MAKSGWVVILELLFWTGFFEMLAKAPLSRRINGQAQSKDLGHLQENN